MSAICLSFLLFCELQVASTTVSLLQVATSTVSFHSSAEPSDAGMQQREEALIESAATQEDSAALRPPQPAAWFGGFSEGESTYASDGTFADRNVNPEVNVMTGWNPQQKNPLYQQASTAQWFEETPSGGADRAWQTFYPSVSGASTSGNSHETGKWYRSLGGQMQQAFLKRTSRNSLAGNLQSATDGLDVPAAWFDSSVSQLDGYGRPPLPPPGSNRISVGWREKSANTTLECKAAGCTAAASLSAPFDHSREEVKNCRLSIFFRPTDFDDPDGEHVEWIQVNGRRVATKCQPRMSGCNQTAQRPLLPCVRDTPIDVLMSTTGALNISAKISDSVDECPYKGKMLSAVPMVTCLVKAKDSPVVLNERTAKECTKKVPFRCRSKGCKSKIAIPIGSTCHSKGNCLLSIQVRQTDYDSKDGTNELIEYIKVNGQQVKANLKPGQNPCKSKWSGRPLTSAQMNYTALSNHPINASTHLVEIEGKISSSVDECASDGYLFDALATVTCGVPVPGRKSR